MLRFLGVEKLAVIDRLEIEFGSGLNVLTGETGAGKSILVEALGLLIGGRASPDLVRTGEDTATVQAIFEEPDGRDVIVRREVTSQGRSRAFIDGALATVGALKELGTRLVELHGQQEHQALLDPESHLAILDAHAGLTGRAQALAEVFGTLRALRDRLASARLDEREKAARIDLASFQLGEIEKVRPRRGGAGESAEDVELLALRAVLANAEKLQRLCGESYGLLYEDDRAVLSSLGQIWRRIAELAAVDPKFAPYLDARDAVKSQLEDLAFFLRDYAAGIDASPARLQQIEDRLAALERLKRKYGPTLNDVLEKQAGLTRELEDLDTAGDRLVALERERRAAASRYLDLARVLSADRRRAAATFARELERQLRELAMERTRFEVRFTAPPTVEPPEDRWTTRGIDDVEFYVSPNPGEELRPLARIASGGELSRMMLAVKTVAAAESPGKTLIFDEIDAGIGGRVAAVVGERLRRLGRDFQVLSITHLPQIAAYAGTHFTIVKTVRQGRTLTEVARLADRDRVEELARMLGGAEVTDRARASARELLTRAEHADEGKTKGESESAKAKGQQARAQKAG